MAISFPLKSSKTERLTISRKQSATESNTNYAVQVVHSGSQWALEWSWPQMHHVEAEAISAWLGKLKGQVGTFTYGPHQSVQSSLTGLTLAMQSYAGNEAIHVTGYAANAPSQLRGGQYFQLGTQLLRITDTASTANASGALTIFFEPELRFSLPLGTALNFTNPVGTFRLNASEGLGYTLDPDRLPEMGTLSAREAF